MNTANAEMNRLVVDAGELAVSKDPNDMLVTYALGSCIGVCIYDPEAGVAGLLHAMLPSITKNPRRGGDRPQRFVDSGLTMLFKQAYALGANKKRVIVKVAGGASTTPQGRQDSFQIGKRNVIAFRKILWKNGVLLDAEDTGGNKSRTVSLNVATGEVVLSSSGKKRPL